MRFNSHMIKQQMAWERKNSNLYVKFIARVGTNFCCRGRRGNFLVNYRFYFDEYFNVRQIVADAAWKISTFDIWILRTWKHENPNGACASPCHHRPLVHWLFLSFLFLFCSVIITSCSVAIHQIVSCINLALSVVLLLGGGLSYGQKRQFKWAQLFFIFLFSFSTLVVMSVPLRIFPYLDKYCRL